VGGLSLASESSRCQRQDTPLGYRFQFPFLVKRAGLPPLGLA